MGSALHLFVEVRGGNSWCVEETPHFPATPTLPPPPPLPSFLPSLFCTSSQGKEGGCHTCVSYGTILGPFVVCVWEGAIVLDGRLTVCVGEGRTGGAEGGGGGGGG
eukprot:Sspe_Gene.24542::Locus_9732_Transcript_6_13_Confidence_0.131_Length_644::g.24542::m.24542